MKFHISIFHSRKKITFDFQESIEDLEARLYAEVYHDTNIESTSPMADNLPPNLNKQSNKRYWLQSKNLSTQNVSQLNEVEDLNASFVLSF